MLNMASPTPVLDMTSTEPLMMLGVSMCHLRRAHIKKHLTKTLLLLLLQVLCVDIYYLIIWSINGAFTFALNV